MNPEELLHYQRLFLDMYNVEMDANVAISRALNATVQRNPLYIPDLNKGLRAEFRIFWGHYLQDIAMDYLVPRTFEQYQQDILNLQQRMNENWAHVFRGGQNGFRISHAQKSISVYLKHLWCIRNVQNENANEFPTLPCCPVDRKILCAAHAPRVNRRWTLVNTIEEYIDQFGYLERAAALENLSVAEWELLTFGNLNNP